MGRSQNNIVLNQGAAAKDCEVSCDGHQIWKLIWCGLRSANNTFGVKICLAKEGLFMHAFCEENVFILTAAQSDKIAMMVKWTSMLTKLGM